MTLLQAPVMHSWGGPGSLWSAHSPEQVESSFKCKSWIISLSLSWIFKCSLFSNISDLILVQPHTMHVRGVCDDTLGRGKRKRRNRECILSKFIMLFWLVEQNHFTWKQ